MLAVELDNIEREDFDRSIVKHQKHQNFPCQNFALENLVSLGQTAIFSTGHLSLAV